MSIYKNGKLIAGGRQYHPDLFDHKWADHILNDVQWLRADTFSWQSKSAYTVAYNHLADDINGKSLTSETVSGVTVQFYLADDGHKICPASEENNVTAIYNATGVAWYYIIDTVNERFKLPRVNPDKELLVQTSPVVGNGQTIKFNAPQNGVNLYDKELIVNRYDYGGNIKVQRTMLLDQNIPNASTGSALTWSRSGLVADLTSATGIYEGKKYLYFYVGQFTQTALENTAGINTEIINDFSAHRVIAFQAPTAENNYMWYRKYADGWVEQGGTTIGIANNSNVNVSLPITMSDTNYTVTIAQLADTLYFYTNQGGLPYDGKHTTYIVLTNRRFIGDASWSIDINWQVSGMAA